MHFGRGLQLEPSAPAAVFHIEAELYHNQTTFLGNAKVHNHVSGAGTSWAKAGANGGSAGCRHAEAVHACAHVNQAWPRMIVRPRLLRSNDCSCTCSC